MLHRRRCRPPAPWHRLGLGPARGGSTSSTSSCLPAPLLAWGCPILSQRNWCQRLPADIRKWKQGCPWGFLAADGAEKLPPCPPLAPGPARGKKARSGSPECPPRLGCHWHSRRPLTGRGPAGPCVNPHPSGCLEQLRCFQEFIMISMK